MCPAPYTMPTVVGVLVDAIKESMAAMSLASRLGTIARSSAGAKSPRMASSEDGRSSLFIFPPIDSLGAADKQNVHHKSAIQDVRKKRQPETCSAISSHSSA